MPYAFRYLELKAPTETGIGFGSAANETENRNINRTFPLIAPYRQLALGSQPDGIAMNLVVGVNGEGFRDLGRTMIGSIYSRVRADHARDQLKKVRI